MAAMEAAPGGNEKSWGTYGGLFSSRSFLFLILTGTVIALVDALTINICLFTADKGLVTSYFFVNISITALAVRLLGAPLLNVLPRVALLAQCGILMSCSIILVSFRPSNSTLAVGGILFGVGLGAGWPMYHALIGDLLSPALLPKGTATALLLYDIGFCLTPLIVGYFSPRFGIAETFAAIALVAGSILVLIEVLYWLPLYWKSRSTRT
jgi:MFS family permease